MSARKALAICLLLAAYVLGLHRVAWAVQPPSVLDGIPVIHTVPDSPRLIIELESPPLSAVYGAQVQAAGADGRLDANAPGAQAYISQLQAEQAAFVAQMQAILPQARVSTFTNESGLHESSAYQITFNGLAIDPGTGDREAARKLLTRLPGVKAIYLDRIYQTDLYTSTTLIGAPVAWNGLGGRANAGAGIKVASVDAGVHNQSHMFSGTGYAYPAGFGPNGKGLTSNNNGKIIASRAYFRDNDPPIEGSADPWPGPEDSSHGVHTASTAAGNLTAGAVYAGLNIGAISGVAPRSYVMSYKVFYASESGTRGFASAEGIAALEDVVADGADIVNNSWGAGPYAQGGEADPLDQALINASAAGVFVVMSVGNAGPYASTADHPSLDYMTVAASTTGGNFVSGSLRVPAAPLLKDIAWAASRFGPVLEPGTVITHSFVTAISIDPSNEIGCDPFPVDAFTDKAVLIRRGNCDFSTKVINAQDAGAVFVLLYNNTGEDDIVPPGCTNRCEEVAIPSGMVGQDNGNALIQHYNSQGSAKSSVEITAIAFQLGADADRIADFSSRGPGVSNVLKPDIAAPGANIVAQGFAAGVEGEAVHFGYGQVSGTSMAAPHVAGAAALVRQAHSTWSNAAVKSALMSTARYQDVYNFDGTPAQPLDMGAGRLDLAHVLDPGVILTPPSLSFGRTMSGTQKSIAVQVTSVATRTETYVLGTVYTGGGFTQTTSLPGFSVVPATLVLAPGEMKTITVTINPATSQGYGENQGYVVLDGSVHDAHMPAWARVVPAPALADVLLIDNDASESLGTPDYRWYYTTTLEQLGLTYAVINVDVAVGQATTIPQPALLAGYRYVLWFTGDNFLPDGAAPFPTGLTTQDQYWLLDFLNGGGKLIAMGQDLASAIGSNDGSFGPLYTVGLGARAIQDSVSNGATPQKTIAAGPGASTVFAGVNVDLTQTRMLVALGDLSGAKVVPPNGSPVSGDFQMSYDLDQNRLEFAVTVVVTPAAPITLTGASINAGAVGNAGAEVRSLLPAGFAPAMVTDEYRFTGTLTDLARQDIDNLLAGKTYVNLRTATFPAGEFRGQIEMTATANQPFVDEVATVADDNGRASSAILRYDGPSNLFDGTVAIGNRQYPLLEYPQIAFAGRTFYAAFGLEGMSEAYNSQLGLQPATRRLLLERMLAWLNMEPGVATVADTTPPGMNGSTVLTAHYVPPSDAARTQLAQATTAILYRWDFGDGSRFVAFGSDFVGHSYLCTADNVHTVRVEVVDDRGTVAIGSLAVDASHTCTTEPVQATNLYLPSVSKQ